MHKLMAGFLVALSIWNGMPVDPPVAVNPNPKSKTCG